MTLVTAKTQKLLFTCVCTRAREASRTHHFTFLNTICSLPFLSHKISISPNLLFHLFPMPSHPFSTFHKTTACFLQNDGSFFIKHRLVFIPKRDTRSSTTKLSDIYSLGKSSHCVTQIFRKRHFHFVRTNIISTFALHIHILKHFPYGC